jgi:hypothetical protein
MQPFGSQFLRPSLAKPELSKAKSTYINPITGSKLQYNIPQENLEIQNENSLRIRHKKLINFQNESLGGREAYPLLTSQVGKSNRNGSVPLHNQSTLGFDLNQSQNTQDFRLKPPLKTDRRVLGGSLLPEVVRPLIDPGLAESRVDQSRMERQIRELMDANSVLQSKVSRLAEHVQADRDAIARVEDQTRQLNWLISDVPQRNQFMGQAPTPNHNDTLLSNRVDQNQSISSEKFSKMWGRIKEIQEAQSRMKSTENVEIDRLAATLDAKIDKQNAVLGHERERVAQLQGNQERIVERLERMMEASAQERERLEGRLRGLELRGSDIDRLASELKTLGKAVRVEGSHHSQRVSDNVGQMATKLAVLEVELQERSGSRDRGGAQNGRRAVKTGR